MARIARTSQLVAVGLVLAACAGEPKINGWTVEVDEKAGVWRVFAPHVESTASAAASLSGPVAARIAAGTASVEVAFGQFSVSLEGDAVATDWSEPLTRVSATTRTPGQVRIDLERPGSRLPASLVFRAHGGADLEIALESDDPASTAGEFRFSCREGESFFGLGTQATGMDLRGRTFPLIVQEQGIGKPEKLQVPLINNIPEAAYAPMGVWHSSAGWSAVVGHDAYSELSLCDGEHGALRSYPLLPSMVLVAGATPRERMRSVTAYTGRLSTPPDWIFAPWNSAVGGPGELDRVAKTLREKGIPSSVIWTEDWIGGSLTRNGFRLSYRWEWDHDTYPDLPGRIRQLNRDGFAFLGYFNPFIPQTVPTYVEALEERYLVMNEDGEPYITTDPAFRQTGMIDLTNPDARTWLSGFVRRAVEEVGLHGWMADFAEWMPVSGVKPAGEGDLFSIHNRYPLMWQRVHREVLEETFAASGGRANDFVFFARSGWASVNGGSGGLIPALWGGDQNTDFSRDDGLPTVVPIGTHAGLSGVSIFGSDIAGYASFVNPPSDKQLYLRWTSLGAFTPLMRTHHGSSKCDNWRFDRDEETLAHFRRYARIHTLLLPYFRSLVPDAVSDGLPLMRHPWLVSPGTPGLWKTAQYQYFLGDDLMVAPVIEQDATNREVYFPSRNWWSLFGSPVTELDAGEGETLRAELDAPMTEIPVFVRPGTVLPLLPAVVDSFFGASSPAVSDLSDVADSLLLALYPDESGGLRELEIGGLRVWGRSIAPHSIDQAKVDGRSVAACSATIEPPCLEGGRLHLQVTTAEVEVGAGRIEFVADRPMRITLAIAGDAWGELASPTAMTELNPEVPPLCD